MHPEAVATKAVKAESAGVGQTGWGGRKGFWTIELGWEQEAVSSPPHFPEAPLTRAWEDFWPILASDVHIVGLLSSLMGPHGPKLEPLHLRILLDIVCEGTLSRRVLVTLLHWRR
jgi:hypothetical protein